MKFRRIFTVFLLVLTCKAFEQVPLGTSLDDLQFENHNNEPGYDLHLDSLRLIELFDNAEQQWATERQKLQLKASGTGFYDLTDTPWLSNRVASRELHTYPDVNGSKATETVTSIISTLSIDECKANLRHFSSYWSRYYNSVHGKASSGWLASKIVNYTEQYSSDEDKRNITVMLVQHRFMQNSIIVRLASMNASDSDPITIVGAHCDSINRINPYLSAPGADDDGSGTVAILEALRGILMSGYVPTSPAEFHFYAGEEGGLLGSLDISERYLEAGKRVRGMHQVDTVAWVKEGSEEVIGVYTNLADKSLTEFQKSLIDKYLDIPWKESRYPERAGSDHMSWSRAGYQTCHVTEAIFENFNKNLHTPNDKIDISKEFSFEHLFEYSKLAAAFAVELSDY